MSLRLLACTKRWFDILAYSVVGALSFRFLGPPLGTHLLDQSQQILGTGTAARILADSLAILLMAFIVRFSKMRIRHFRHATVYPPLPLAIILGCLIALLIPSLSNGNLASKQLPWQATAFAELLFALVWATTTGYLELRDSLLTPIQGDTKADATARLAGKPRLSDNALKEWLQREAPIENTDWDTLGHAPIAKRLLERLQRGENTIALQGAFGSGKSSLAAMTRHIAGELELPLVFVQVSCWGFDDARRAQEEILCAMVKEIGSDVDCLSIQNVPSAYLESISEHAGWLKSLLQIASRDRTPLEQLQRLSPILLAIKKRIIIFVEDVDRNSLSFDLSQIQALLIQFREVTGISFVLSISPTQQIDFARLCEFVEIVAPLEPRQVLPLIHQTREMLLREHPVPVLLDKLQPLTSDDDDYSNLYTYAGPGRPWQFALCSLLNTPRNLKTALRRLADTWPRLCGEVNIDDLISISALRVGAPEAFAFFSAKQPLFQPAAKPGNSHLLTDQQRTQPREDLQQEWTKISEKALFDVRAAAAIMKELDPSTYAFTGVSGVHRGAQQAMHSRRRGPIYARRLLAESLSESEPRDQSMLMLIERAQKETSGLRDLAELITDSQPSSDAFEYFAPYVGFDATLELLTEVYALIRRVYGAKIKREEHPGFFAPWRLLLDRPRPPHFEEWIINELRKCIPTNLRLMTEVYYFWLGTDKHTEVERRAPRRAIYESLKEAWLSGSSTEISSGFDGDHPYTLFHIVFTSDYQKPETVPYCDSREWSWIGPPMLDAISADPDCMLPQLIVALNTSSARGMEIPRYEFDEVLLRTWFGDRASEFLGLVARGFSIRPDISAQLQYLLKAAIEKANERLKHPDDHRSHEVLDTKASVSVAHVSKIRGGTKRKRTTQKKRRTI